MPNIIIANLGWFRSLTKRQKIVFSAASILLMLAIGAIVYIGLGGKFRIGAAGEFDTSGTCNFNTTPGVNEVFLKNSDGACRKITNYGEIYNLGDGWNDNIRGIAIGARTIVSLFYETNYEVEGYTYWPGTRLVYDPNKTSSRNFVLGDAKSAKIWWHDGVNSDITNMCATPGPGEVILYQYPDHNSGHPEGDCSVLRVGMFPDEYASQPEIKEGQLPPGQGFPQAGQAVFVARYGVKLNEARSVRIGSKVGFLYYNERNYINLSTLNTGNPYESKNLTPTGRASAEIVMRHDVTALSVNPVSITMAQGTQATFTVKGGVPGINGYQLSANSHTNNAIVGVGDVTQSWDESDLTSTFTIHSHYQQGSSSVRIQDVAGRQQDVAITVTAEGGVTLSENNLHLLAGSGKIVNINGGSGHYNATANNIHVTATILTGGKVSIHAVDQGVSIVSVEDTDKHVTLGIYVNVYAVASLDPGNLELALDGTAKTFDLNDITNAQPSPPLIVRPIDGDFGIHGERTYTAAGSGDHRIGLELTRTGITDRTYLRDEHFSLSATKTGEWTAEQIPSQFNITFGTYWTVAGGDILHYAPHLLQSFRLTITFGGTMESHAPSISIVADPLQVAPGGKTAVTAQVTDADNDMSRVVFRYSYIDGDTPRGGAFAEDINGEDGWTADFELGPDAPPGMQYNLWAVAVDRLGLQGVSNEVIINNPSDLLRVNEVTVTPTNDDGKIVRTSERVAFHVKAQNCNDISKIRVFYTYTSYTTGEQTGQSVGEATSADSCVDNVGAYTILFPNEDNRILPAGELDITATAYKGDEHNSLVGTFIVNNELPMVTISEPVDGKTYDIASGQSGVAVTVKANVKDSDGWIDHANVKLIDTTTHSAVSGCNLTPMTVVSGSDNNVNYAYTCTDVPAGKYQVVIHGVDKDGGSGRAATEPTIMVNAATDDTTSPTVNIIKPSDGQTFTVPNSSVEIQADVSDDIQLWVVDFYIGEDVNHQSAHGDGRYSYTAAALACGQYEVMVEAVDTAGNVTTKAVNISVTGCEEGDSDSDGVPDSEDQCLDTPGLKDNHGCPENVCLDGKRTFATKSQSWEVRTLPFLPADNFKLTNLLGIDKVLTYYFAGFNTAYGKGTDANATDFQNGLGFWIKNKTVYNNVCIAAGSYTERAGDTVEQQLPYKALAMIGNPFQQTVNTKDAIKFKFSSTGNTVIGWSDAFSRRLIKAAFIWNGAKYDAYTNLSSYPDFAKYGYVDYTKFPGTLTEGQGLWVAPRSTETVSVIFQK